MDYEVENEMPDHGNGDDERSSLAIVASRADRWQKRQRTKEAPRPGCAF